MKPIERLGQRDMALLTDLYQLTMLQAYWAEGMRERALFSLHFRDLPPHRNFMQAARICMMYWPAGTKSWMALPC